MYPTPAYSEGSQELASGSRFIGQEGFLDSDSPSTRTHLLDRRFSDVYGHGHLLDDAAIPIDFTAKKKRRGSESSEKPSPKRVRFSPTEDHESVASDEKLHFEDALSNPDPKLVHDLSIARRDLAFAFDIESNPDLHLLTALRDATEPLSISQISSLLYILQSLTGDFASKYFADAIMDSWESVELDMKHFPLEHLKLKHHSLYLTTVNVLDASTTDILDDSLLNGNHAWHKFFAHPNYRPYLVSAVLGEWFTQRIFKDSAFGLSPAGRKEIEEGVDKQYIYFDSFVRAKKRSAVVGRHRTMPHADRWLQEAARSLADELMIVLAPLLPFPKTPASHNAGFSAEDSDHEVEIRTALFELIIHCAVVNLGIVRTGENGTIVRPAHRLQKGKQFYPTAPMDCVNPTLCDLNRDQTERGKNERLAVKMTCWPRMEGWVPHGMDKEEMSKLERDVRLEKLPFYLRSKILRGDALTPEELRETRQKFCWDCSSFIDYWDVLPVELRLLDKEKREKRQMREKAHRAQQKIHKAELRKSGENDDPDSSDSSSRPDDEHNPDKAEDEEDHPRGAWITEYTCLAPHTVYCEWVKPENHYIALANNDGANDGKSILEINSLENAIKDARKNLPGPTFALAQTEDVLVKLWGFYASHNLEIEWGTFLIAVLAYIWRGGSVSNATDMVTIPVKLTARILNQASEVLGLNVFSQGVVGFTKGMVHGRPQAGLADQLNPANLHVPKKVLNDAHSYVDNNLGIFKAALWNIITSGKEVFSGASERGKSKVSTGISSMTHFVGSRQPFTTNPVSLSHRSSSIPTPTNSIVHADTSIQNSVSYVQTLLKEPSATIGPTVTALASSAAAFTAQLTGPVYTPPSHPVVTPVGPVANIQGDPVLVGEPPTVLPDTRKTISIHGVLDTTTTVGPTPVTVTEYKWPDGGPTPAPTTERTKPDIPTASKISRAGNVNPAKSNIVFDAASKAASKAVNAFGDLLYPGARGRTSTRTVTHGGSFTLIANRGRAQF